MKAALLFVCLVGVAWAETEQPFRRPLSPVVLGGWTQVQLDAEAQRHADSLWLADAEGRPVPFLRESEASGKDVPLTVRDFVTGRDDAGNVTAEFVLTRPDGRPVEQRESMRLIAPGALGVMLDTRKQMRVTLEVDASGPWAADVAVAFDQFGQGWVNEDQPRQIYDFGAGERRLEFKVRRIAPKWRVRLTALRGEIRGVRAVQVRAEGLPGPLSTLRSALGVARDEDRWTLTSPRGALRVHAVHLQLRGTVAPVRAELFRIDGEAEAKDERETWVASGLVWEMPGLGSRAGEVRLTPPALAERFRLKLPSGVEVVQAEAEFAGESLWFVAEKKVDYFLHFASEKQIAPGNLAALPPVLDGALPDFLPIGPPEPDPYGKPLREDISVVLKRWLPWIVALAVAVLTGVALRLLLPQSGADKKKPAA